MPKKTRKEKIRADIHSIHTHERVSYSYSTPTFSPSMHTPAVEKFITADIKKTVIFGIVFIALEVAFYSINLRLHIF